MMRAVGRTLLVAAAATQLVATACNDSQGPQPDASLLPSLPLPGLATLVVSTSTSGSSLDPDGYTVTVDGGSSQSIGTNGVATFVGLAAGDHTVLLSGVARNCTVSGSNPRTVSLIAGLVGATGFSVSCVAQPTTGNLAVTTNTTGSNLDPDGYTLTVDGGQSKAIGINNTVTISGLSPGNHSVQLNGVAQNCTVSGSNPRTVSITAGSTTTTTFTVSCAATTGNLTVSNSTTGSNHDADADTVTVAGRAGTASKTMTTNGNASTANVTAANCTVTSANPQTANVPSGGTATTSFTVSCAATTTTGTLSVTTATTGQSQPTGYTLNVTGPSFPTGTSQPIGANATVTATVTAGDYQVSLSGVPSNCTVSGANPRTVTVPANGTGPTTFSVSCTAPTTTGTLSVTTSTTGQNIPASYTLNVTGPSFPTGTSQPIGANATVTATVTSGDYQVSLSGVPSNCTVSGANPRTVTVPANGTGPTTFSVSCAAPTTTGTLSVTTATTGQNIPASYTLNVTGPSFPTGTSQPINANGNVTATVTSGDYQVSLRAVPSNCTVSGANPRTVTVPAAGPGPT